MVSISPEEAGAHFGFVSKFAGLDLSASIAITLPPIVRYVLRC